MARVHLRCYSYEFHWPVCSKFLIQPWQRRLYGLVVLEQVPIMLCSFLVNYSWQQPENAVACVRCPIWREFLWMCQQIVFAHFHNIKCFSCCCMLKMADFIVQINLCVIGFRMKPEHFVKLDGRSWYQYLDKSNILARNNELLFYNQPSIYISRAIALKLWADSSCCDSLSEINSGQVLAGTMLRRVEAWRADLLEFCGWSLCWILRLSLIQLRGRLLSLAPLSVHTSRQSFNGVLHCFGLLRGLVCPYSVLYVKHHCATLCFAVWYLAVLGQCLLY